MPTYTYHCADEHEFEKVLRITECDAPQVCECGKPGKKIISGTSFVLKGDNWPGKSIKLRGQMSRKNARLDRKQAERPPSATLAPNVGGERVDTWAEAQKLAGSQGKDTTSYEPMVAKEQAKT